MREAARRGLHHAWLIAGPGGVGKATLAFRFARALLAGFPGRLLEVSSSDPVFSQVAASSHPNLLTVSSGSGEILLSDVGAIVNFLSLTAAADGWRVVIIDGADALHRVAANALLKLIEEPPRRTVWLLTTRSLLRVPSTLRSRCMVVRLNPLSDDRMVKVLRDSFPGLSDLACADAIRMSGGLPGRAIEFVRMQAMRGSPDIGSAAEGREVLDAAGCLSQAARTIESRVHDLLSDSERIDVREEVLVGCDAWSDVLQLGCSAERNKLDKRQVQLEAERIAVR